MAGDERQPAPADADALPPIEGLEHYSLERRLDGLASARSAAAFYECVHRPSGQTFVLKATPKTDAAAVERATAEAALLQRLQHRGFARLAGLYDVPSSWVQVRSANRAGQTLRRLLEAAGPLSEPDAQELLHQLAQALLHLHAMHATALGRLDLDIVAVSRDAAGRLVATIWGAEDTADLSDAGSADIRALGRVLYGAVAGAAAFDALSGATGKAADWARELPIEAQQLLSHLNAGPKEPVPALSDVLAHPWVQGKRRMRLSPHAAAVGASGPVGAPAADGRRKLRGPAGALSVRTAALDAAAPPAVDLLASPAAVVRGLEQGRSMTLQQLVHRAHGAGTSAWDEFNLPAHLQTPGLSARRRSRLAVEQPADATAPLSASSAQGELIHRWLCDSGDGAAPPAGLPHWPPRCSPASSTLSSRRSSTVDVDGDLGAAIPSPRRGSLSSQSGPAARAHRATLCAQSLGDSDDSPVDGGLDDASTTSGSAAGSDAPVDEALKLLPALKIGSAAPRLL